MSRTLLSRHLDELDAFRVHAEQQARADTAEDAVLIASSPVGRRRLRGIPVTRSGGAADERRDPLLELLDRERDAETRDAIATLNSAKADSA